MNWRPRICPFHLLINAVPQDANVLDIGCGTGLLLFLLSHFQRIYRGVGIEVQRQKIDIAKSLPWKDNQISFLHVGPQDTWPGTDIDCVTMVDVLHHIPPQEQKTFLRKIEQTTAKTIVFKDINPQKIVKAKMNTLHDLVLSNQKPHYQSPQTISGWLRDMGFTDIQVSYPEMLWYSHYLIVARKIT